MSLVRKIRPFAVIAGCLTLCASLASMLAAQQLNPPAPRLFRPQARAVSGRMAQRSMRPMQAGFQQGDAGQYEVIDSGVGTIYSEAPQMSGMPMDEMIIEDDYFEQGDCNQCGGGGDGCFSCGPTCDPRDCDIAADCWLNGLGGLFCNSEIFIGAHSFKNQVFQLGDTIGGPEDCNFGFHAGFNTGLPLYKLTCGLVSGQIGVSYVTSNYSNGLFSPGDRQQTFFTAGLFRRVDYGLQFGAVADVLREPDLLDRDVVQVRSELSYVWPVGHSFGVRFTRNVQDSALLMGGIMNPVNNNAQSINWYNLFYRHACCAGGFNDFFIGRTDEQQTIFGAQYDLPLGPKSALQTGFTYMYPDNELAFSDNEAFNIYMQVSFRPRGREWYKFYHRPLFDVADNGSMILSRN